MEHVSKKGDLPGALTKQEDAKGAHGGDEDLDDLLKPLGGFGKFQILNLFFLCTIAIMCPLSELGFVFTTAELKHRCLISECGETELSPYDESWLSSAVPKLDNGAYDSCRRYGNGTGDLCKNTTVSTESFNCDTFIYETGEWTIAREDWGLECDSEKWKLTLIGSLNNAGEMIGCLFAGLLADRFGRKIVLLVFAITVAAMGTIKSFSVNYIMMAIFEFLESLVACCLYNGPFVLAMEIVDPSKRVLAGALLASTYALGETILGVIQSLTLDWRITVRIMYMPFFILILYFWFLPESLRWLINKNKQNDAMAILHRIAKMNGKEVTQEIEQKLYSIKSEDPSQKVGESKWKVFAETWRSKIMRTRIIVCLYIWMVVTFVFFGMSMTSVSISENKFMNFILSAVIEVPSYLTVFFMLDRAGRRITLSGFLIICGIGCGFSAYVPDDSSWSWAKLVLYLTGKFGAAISFNTLDVYTTEMFPTSIRSTAMGYGLMVGKLATIVAPQMPLLADFYKPLPLLIFSVLSLVAGVTALSFLPETLNLKLPDTIEEAENLGRKKK